MKRFLWACSAIAAYYAVLTIATLMRFHLGQPPTDTASVLWALLPVQLILLLLCMLAAWPRGLRQIGFSRTRWSGIFWLLPSFAVMIAMLLSLFPHIAQLNEVPSIAVLLFVVPALIGLTEEIMFRGVLLRAAMARFSVFNSMLISATLFAFMHGIIGIGGQPGLITVQQIAFAFLVGIFLAPIAIATGTLWIVVIWHAVWDMLVYASQLVGIVHHYALIGIMVQALVSVWLWARLVRADQREVS
jgi:membrane protease YdiL (CAAX protease family)